MKSNLLAAAIITLGTANAYAGEIIRCATKGKPEVVMSLNSERVRPVLDRVTKVVSCIEGEFIEDMTPCATNGGFGLSYPTGAASLASIVNRWQDAHGHFGGVVGHFANAT